MSLTEGIIKPAVQLHNINLDMNISMQVDSLDCKTKMASLLK